MTAKSIAITFIISMFYIMFDIVAIIYYWESIGYITIPKKQARAKLLLFFAAPYALPVALVSLVFYIVLCAYEGLRDAFAYFKKLWREAFPPPPIPPLYDIKLEKDVEHNVGPMR